ncbi:MAG: oxidoreductase [Saprospiraceae bacterium]|nr:oxidoreductase [Saprospiraceae bacterium]
MPRKWTAAQVEELGYASPSVRSLILKVDQETPFDFEPGQFVTFDLDIGEKRLERWRSYSIANPPNTKNKLEFIISKIEGGKASDYFFDKLQLSDTLQMKGPQGTFTLPQNLDQEIIMVCTGTGVAPFKSMIEHVFENKIPHKAIHLIFGTRHKEGILYHDYFKQLAESESSFKYSVALSRESYDGFQGYVHEVYTRHYAQIADNRLFMLCGWQNMIDEAIERLNGLGYGKDKLVYELYG